MSYLLAIILLSLLAIDNAEQLDSIDEKSSNEDHEERTQRPMETEGSTSRTLKEVEQFLQIVENHLKELRETRKVTTLTIGYVQAIPIQEDSDKNEMDRSCNIETDGGEKRSQRSTAPDQAKRHLRSLELTELQLPDFTDPSSANIRPKRTSYRQKPHNFNSIGNVEVAKMVNTVRPEVTNCIDNVNVGTISQTVENVNNNKLVENEVPEMSIVTKSRSSVRTDNTIPERPIRPVTNPTVESFNSVIQGLIRTKQSISEGRATIREALSRARVALRKFLKETRADFKNSLKLVFKRVADNSTYYNPNDNNNYDKNSKF